MFDEFLLLELNLTIFKHGDLDEIIKKKDEEIESLTKDRQNKSSINNLEEKSYPSEIETHHNKRHKLIGEIEENSEESIGEVKEDLLKDKINQLPDVIIEEHDMRTEHVNPIICTNLIKNIDNIFYQICPLSLERKRKMKFHFQSLKDLMWTPQERLLVYICQNLSEVSQSEYEQVRFFL